MTKETIYEPSEEIINNAVISNEEFEELYKESINNPDQFWDQQARNYLSWDKELDVVKESFKEELFSTKIRINTDLATAPSHYKSIFDYAPRSNGAQDFHALLDEFLKKVKKKELTNV